MTEYKMHPISKFVERAVFAVRWMLIPVYLGLVIALGLYIAHFVHEVIEMAINFMENVEQQNILMLFILELVDMAMICQLVDMTIQGGYAIFIRSFDIDAKLLPQWLKHGLGTSEQKIKMGMSVMGILIVNLTKVAVADHVTVPWDDLLKKGGILLLIIIATYAFCKFNLMMHHPMLHAKGDAEHKDDHHE